jgi:hypothetical protein
MRRTNMDEMMRFIVGRNPSILVYKAIFETTEELKYPVDSREHLLNQLSKSDASPEARREVAELVEEVFPAYLFPFTCKQNALEKITEAVELTGQGLVRIVPGQRLSRWTPDPHDPSCEFQCHRIHAAKILDLMEHGLVGADILVGTLQAVKELQACLRRCNPGPMSSPELTRRAQESSASRRTSINEVIEKLLARAKEDPEFFHALVFEPDKVAAEFDDRKIKSAIFGIDPDRLLRTTLLPTQRVADSCYPDSSCECTAGSCGVTCNSSCAVTCSAVSCEVTVNVAPFIRGQADVWR